MKYFKTSLIISAYLLLFSITFANTFNKTSPGISLIHPVETPYGIVLTNEFENTVYLVNGEELKILFESPGCGRYMKFSHDFSLIGFKEIDPVSGLQRPAVYDLKENRIIYLYDFVDRCGQVSFSANGSTAFMIDKILFVQHNGKQDRYKLGFYSNNASISPDGKKVVYNEEDDQLWIFEFNTNSRSKITDDENGYYNAKWSPDGNKIVFESVNAFVYLYNEKGALNLIAEGQNPEWSANSEQIIFYKKEIDFNNVQLLNSDLYIYNTSSRKTQQVTFTTDKFEMEASFSGSDNEIIFTTANKNEINKISLADKEVTSAPESIYRWNESVQTDESDTFYKSIPSPEEITDLGEWVHIHQVFDTRDSGSWTHDPVNGRHQGYLCCGATSAMEVVASYGILPPDPISTYGHTSNYGKYISDAYTYNGKTYSGFSISPNGNPGFTTGAHGFMWNSGSPHSNAVSFLRNHGIEANLSDDMNWSKVKNELDMGFPYILCTTSLTDGHIVVAIGQYQNYKTLYCNDPYGDKNAGSYGGIRNGKNAIYDWGDENTGHIKITPVVWGITARYSKTLQMLTSYPQNDQEDVSPSSHLFVNFYGAVNSASVKDNIKLIDDEGLYNEYTFVESKCSEGTVEIIPGGLLKENSKYEIYISHGIENTGGLKFGRNEKIVFNTSIEGKYKGQILDGFESGQGRQLLQSGTDQTAPGGSVTTEKVKDNQSSLKLDYKFAGSSNGYYRILYSPELPIDNNSTIGLWVFGDYSNNALEFWFTNTGGSLIKGFSKTINWSGWKFIQMNVGDISDLNPSTFNCFAIRQQSFSARAGVLYFDALKLVDALVEVVECNPTDKSENIPINSEFTVVFNRTMNVTSVENAFTISPSIQGSFIWENESTKLTFKPVEALAGKTEYKIAIDTSAVDLSGSSLNCPVNFNFVTERTRLSLINNYPASDESNVSPDLTVVLKFDGAINPTSLYGNIVFTDAQNQNVTIFVDQSQYANGIVSFKPASPLEPGSLYKILIKQGVKDTYSLLFGDEKEINFTTFEDNISSGSVFYDFESSLEWIDPKENANSVGVDFLSTGYSLDSKTKKNGSNSGLLKYRFRGIDGKCVLEPIDPITIGADDSFGIWIYGDFSGNILVFNFIDNQNNNYPVEAGVINWTGWRLVVVDLLLLQSSSDLALNGIVILQTETGAPAGQINIDDMSKGVVLSSENAPDLPTQYSLGQNYPNPFNPVSNIKYEIANTGQVVLSVYDILGREVSVLVNEIKKPGKYQVSFDASDLASGIYFYRLHAGRFTETKKMAFIK